MLQSTENDDTSRGRSSTTDSETELDQLQVIEISSCAESSPSPLMPEMEDHKLLKYGKAHLESPADRSAVGASQAPSAPKVRVLFLNGTRGLAAMLVVIQHSHEYVKDPNIGSVGVDIFFVLSSFLLTWLLMKKCMDLLDHGANLRSWIFMLVDYFQKRFFRVYPLFFVTVAVLAILPRDDQILYFLFSEKKVFDMFKILTFDFDYRYHVFWTLPLEIAYYFVIPFFVLAALGMRRWWWLGAIPLMVFAIYEGIYVFRSNHMPMRPHITTFLTGSVAAVVYVKIDVWIQKTAFKFRWWHTLCLRAIEGLSVAMLLSVCFRGLLFDWVHKNPAPPPKGSPYTSCFLAVFFVAEMIKPSCLSRMLEWNLLRYWGKISFSVYLLHSFVVYNPILISQPNYFDRFFSRLMIIMGIATTSYYLVEYPSQRLAQRISRILAEREKRTDGIVKFTCLEQISTR